MYVTQSDRTRDFGAASPYGEAVLLSFRSVYPDELWKIPETTDVLRHKLAAFNPALDYLLLSGDPAIIAMCSAIIARSRPQSVINLLKWDRENKAYYVVPCWPDVSTRERSKEWILKD